MARGIGKAGAGAIALPASQIARINAVAGRFPEAGRSSRKFAARTCAQGRRGSLSVIDVHEVIENPASNAAVAGPVFNGSCATQYGDTILSSLKTSSGWW